MGLFGNSEQGLGLSSFGDRAITAGLGLLNRGRSGLIAIAERKKELVEGVSAYKTIKGLEANDEDTRMVMAKLTKSGKTIALSEPVSLTVADLPFDMQGVSRLILNTGGIELVSYNDMKAQLVLSKSGYGVKLTCTRRSERFGEKVAEKVCEPKEFAGINQGLRQEFSGPDFQFESDPGYSGEGRKIKLEDDRQGSVTVFKKSADDSTPVEIRVRGLRRADPALFKIDIEALKRAVSAALPELMGMQAQAAA